METNHVDKRTWQFEFLSCAWSISSKYYAEEKLSDFRSVQYGNLEWFNNFIASPWYHYVMIIQLSCENHFKIRKLFHILLYDKCSQKNQTKNKNPLYKPVQCKWLQTFFIYFLEKKQTKNKIPLHNIIAKKLVYIYFFLRLTLGKQLSGLSTFSLSNNKNYRLKKNGVFPL